MFLRFIVMSVLAIDVASEASDLRPIALPHYDMHVWSARCVLRFTVHSHYIGRAMQLSFLTTLAKSYFIEFYEVLIVLLQEYIR